MNQTHIYCELCSRIQPLVVADNGGGDVTGRYTDSADLLCGGCQLILATVYNKAPEKPTDG